MARDDTILANGENRQDTEGVPAHYKSSGCNRSPISTHNRAHNIRPASCPPSTTTLQSPLTSEGRGFGSEEFSRLRQTSGTFTGSSGRPAVVDQLPERSQWQSHLPSGTITGSRVRCLQEGLGCPLQGEQCSDRWPLDTRGITSPHQLTGTEGSPTCHSVVCEASKLPHPDVSRQPGCHSLHQPDGWNTFPTFVQAGFGNGASNTVHAEHLPGRLNRVADFESRHLSDCSDWRLSPKVFSQLNYLFGPFSIDLFASHLNTQTTWFYSWRPDPQAIAVDALAHPWNRERPYAFPPKVRREQSESLLLIAPIWPAQVWYPLLLSMLNNDPVTLPFSPDLLPNPQQEQHPLILNHHLALAAWPISGIPSQTRAYHRRVQISSASHGGKGQQSRTTPLGDVGSAGVTSGVLIPFLPLSQILSSS